MYNKIIFIMIKLLYDFVQFSRNEIIKLNRD